MNDIDIFLLQKFQSSSCLAGRILYLTFFEVFKLSRIFLSEALPSQPPQPPLPPLSQAGHDRIWPDRLWPKKISIWPLFFVTTFGLNLCFGFFGHVWSNVFLHLFLCSVVVVHGILGCSTFFGRANQVWPNVVVTPKPPTPSLPKPPSSLFPRGAHSGQTALGQPV